MEELDYLLRYLLDENKKVQADLESSSMKEKEDLYRALVNIRPAKQISEEYLDMEDEYLRKELRKKTLTDKDDIESIQKVYPESKLANSGQMALWQGDITRIKIDAIVNAANSQGLGCFVPLHNCIDNQIHTSAGIRLRLRCNQHMKDIDYHLDTGEAFITPAYNLPSKYVIHTVGPIITGSVTKKDEKLLENCYINSLELCRKNKIRSIAFCCISTGVFGYPKNDACRCALKCVDEYLNEYGDYFDKIVFNVHGNEDVIIYEQHIRQYQ